MTAPLDVARSGHVTRLTLNRPDKRNALSVPLLQALKEAQADIASESGIRVVVLAANGPVFSSGHDLRELRETSPEGTQALFELCTEVMLGFRALPQPVIARVHGLATAAGCQLACSADLVVASTYARFATPGVKIGLFCSTPMVPLARAISPVNAMEMLLTGEPVTAERAFQMGLVNRVVDQDHLDPAIDEFVAQIAQSSFTTVKLGKRAFYDQLGLPEATAYAHTTPTMVKNAGMDVAKEGIAAFLDKRSPNWPR